MGSNSGVRIVVLLGCTWLPAGSALARVGEAEVRAGPRGDPCFTIAPREERPGVLDFGAIVVADGAHPVWKLVLPKERTFPLTPGTCVPYGGHSPALPRTASAPLVPGRVYTLRIDARPGGHAHAAASYEARFCLAQRHGGSAVVRQLHSGEHDAAAAKNGAVCD